MSADCTKILSTSRLRAAGATRFGLQLKGRLTPATAPLYKVRVLARSGWDVTFSPRSTRRDIKMRSKAWRRHAHATFFPYSARCAFVRVCKSAALHLLVMVRNYANRFQSPPLLFRVCICLHFAPSRNLHFARILFVVPRSPAGFGFLQDNFLFENLTFRSSLER